MAVGVLKQRRLILFNRGPNAQSPKCEGNIHIGFAINVLFPYEVILHFVSHPPLLTVYRSEQSAVFMDAEILPVLS